MFVQAQRICNRDPAPVTAQLIEQTVRGGLQRDVGDRVMFSEQLIHRLPQAVGVQIADKCGLSLSVHMPAFQGELGELIDILRPGDIFCHVYTPQKGILEDGVVSREMTRAVEKGIVLESACGKGHFGHDCAAAVLSAGIKPDIISGDFTRKTLHYQPAFSLPYLMSRFLALGMSFADVFPCRTSTPAKKMGMEGEIGCLKPGAHGNIAVFKRREGRFTFADVRDSRITGEELLVPMLTVWEGDLVYRNGELITF